MTRDRAPITCEWHGCGQSPDHDGLCERHARRDAGLRCDGGHEETDDAVEHETDGDALFHGEIEAHLRGGRLRLLWKDADAHEMLALLAQFINQSDTDALAWWGDPPIGSDRKVGQWMNIDISEMGEQTDEQIETDGGMHVRHRRIHIREQGNETDYPTGVGVEFPSGTVVVEWIREAWPPEERLDGAHQSHYASLADLSSVVSGSIYVVDGDDEEIVTDGGTVVPADSTTETSKVWDGPFVERDKFGEPTGYRYVRCRSCGIEVIEHEREHATHRDGCEHAVDRGDGVETDGGKVSELSSLIAQLAEETAEEVDDEDGIDGVWERSVPARAREFDDWLIALNFDADDVRYYQLSEDHSEISLRPARGRIWPGRGEAVPMAMISPSGGQVAGTPDDDLEGELIRDVRAELKRVRSGEIVTDGGIQVPKQTVPEGAARLGFKSAADARTGAWLVASETDGDDVTITNDSGGWWTVEIDRRQSESCWIGRLETDEWVGVCTCTDYDPDDLSDSGRSWPCAELSVLRQQFFIGRIKLDESFDQIDPSALGGDD